jgi:hypothetical protein
MPINTSSQFDLRAQLPLRLYSVVADTTARDAIPTINRFDGFTAYSVADTTTYQLQGGITNSDWVDVGGATLIVGNGLTDTAGTISAGDSTMTSSIYWNTDSGSSYFGLSSTHSKIDHYSEDSVNETFTTFVNTLSGSNAYYELNAGIYTPGARYKNTLQVRHNHILFKNDFTNEVVGAIGYFGQYGFYYDADYSGNWTDRYLVDKGYVDGKFEPQIQSTGTIADNDDTPDVAGANVWTYAGSANSVTITDLDNPQVGAAYTIIGNSDTYTVTIANSGNFSLSGGSWVGGIDDSITLYCQADNDYIELSRSNNSEVIQFAVSDEATALTTGTDKMTFRMPYAMTLTEARASIGTVGGTSGTTTVDINDSGTTILSTKLTIDYGEKTSTTAATPAVISDSTLADDAEITVDIDALTGDATEAGLKITLIGTRA